MAPFVNDSICLSQSCIQASSTIYNRLSSNFANLDPCTNFEELVCGGLRERNVIPAWEDHLRESNFMNDANYILMKNILEAPYNASWDAPGSVDEQNFDQLVRGYNACMNETAISGQGVQPLITFLGNVTENFLITPEGYTNPEIFGPDDYELFSKTYRYFVEHSMFPFLSLAANFDPDYPQTYIPVIMPTAPALPSVVYADEKARTQYEAVIAQVFSKILPTDEAKSAANGLASALVDLEQKIAAAAPAVSLTDLINVMTLDNYTHLAPEFDLASVFATISPSPVNRTSYPFPEYSAWLSQTLANTTKPAIQAYFLWQAITYFEPAVEGPEIQPYKEFMNILAGKKPGFFQDRSRTCVMDADSKMAWLLSKPFIEVRYTDAIKKTLEEMTTRIQHRLANNINHIEWMTDKVKAIAKHKVESITPKLGYPTQSPNLDDPNSIRDYYTGLDISDSHFDNSVSYSKWFSKKSASLIGTQREEGAWGTEAGSALTINAFYTGQENAIIIIAGTLQQQLLDPGVPSYLNYGALGTVIGHELTHSLDSTGRLFDERGAWRDWWDSESEAGFHERAQCLVEQYGSNNITVAGQPQPVNGTLTLGENIADTGGVNTAWDAWQDKRREDPRSDLDLPGLRDAFTHEQLFFVAASQFFCDESNDIGMAAYAADVHSPPAVRIKSMIENSRGFREAFNCPVKEPTCVIY